MTSCLRDAVAVRDLAGEPVGGVIFVQRGDERWRWDLPHPVWPIDTFAETVRRDLVEFPEPRVFVAALRDREREQLLAGLRGLTDEPRSTLPWYAEERTRHRAQVMSGLAEVGGVTQPSKPALRDLKEVERAGRRMLGHASRRRYRIHRR